MMRYQELGEPTFTVESKDGSERIVIRPARHVGLSLFLFAWLGAWTVGGYSAAKTLHEHFTPFIAFWMVAWACGEAFVLLQLGWFWTGRETVGIVGGDLEVVHAIYGLPLRKLFRGGDIRDLAADPVLRTLRYQQASLPFLPGNKVGCIHFAYGAKTVYIGADLDVVEGQMIVDRLSKRLPAMARRRLA